MITPFFTCILVVLSSWGVGGLVNEYLRTLSSYKSLTTMVFIKKDKLNAYLGVNLFQVLVSKSWYSKINKTINLKDYSFEGLKNMRKHIESGEMGHLIGLTLVQAYFLIQLILEGSLSHFSLGTILNILLNLYPILLQQKNKLRIDRLLNQYRKTDG